MSNYCKAPAMSSDSDREGRIARPMGQEGNMDHAQGASSRKSVLSDAVGALKTQVARGSAAPTVGGRKMTDY
jgi:hypothetical protein